MQQAFQVLFATLMTVTACGAAAVERPFFCFDNGLRDVEGLEAQAALVKELGFVGLGGREGAAKAKLAALDAHDLEMVSCYVVLKASADACPLSDSLKREIALYKGRETVLWLVIQGESRDAVVVPAIREVADLAASSGLRVALYPHFGNYTDTVDTCFRLMEQADRPNLGLSFNLCHFLRQHPSAELEATLRKAAPHLMLVQISGADDAPPGTANWDQLIRPLGEGTFDVRRVLHALDAISYEGPVGLQCYNIKRPARDHLSASMKTWKSWHAGD